MAVGVAQSFERLPLGNFEGINFESVCIAKFIAYPRADRHKIFVFFSSRVAAMLMITSPHELARLGSPSAAPP